MENGKAESRFSLLDIDDDKPNPKTYANGTAIADGICTFFEWARELSRLDFDITPPASFRPVTAMGALMSTRMAR